MIRTRDRKSAAGLLPRMEARERKDGKTTYRFHPLGGKPVNLGTDRQAAIRKVLDLNGRADDSGTIDHLWRLYQEDELWTKLAPDTQAVYARSAKPLLKVFGSVHAASITQQMMRRYMKKERAGIPSANREIAILSNLLKVAVDHGYVASNPAFGLQWLPTKHRTAIPLDNELDAFLTWLRGQTPQRAVIAAMAEFAARTGARRTEFLRATIFQVRDGEARLGRAKQRQEEITDVIELSPEAMAVIEAVRREGCEYLFPNVRGVPYTSGGFYSVWRTALLAAIKAKIVSRHFTFHDLRAHYTSKHKRTLGALPDLHKNPKMTATVYDRNVEVRRKAL